MLSLAHLLEEAESNGLPLSKTRGILREYLQVIVLNSVYKHKYAKQMFFMGGTALRFFHNMPRFSEDLDFDTPSLTFEEFREILKSAKDGLTKEGFSTEISSEKRDNLYIAELHFKDLMELYKLTDKRGPDLMMKVEVYRPAWELGTEPGALDLYNYKFTSILLGKGNLISEKLCALINRKRGRDVYDILFMLKKKFPFDKKVLLANKIESQPKELILEYLKSLTEKELNFLAKQVSPFLFKEDDVELILKSSLFAERFLREYE